MGGLTDGPELQRRREPGDRAPSPAGIRRPSKERELLDRIYAAEKPASKAPADGMNKLERAFRDEVLEPAWVRGRCSNTGASR